MRAILALIGVLALLLAITGQPGPDPTKVAASLRAKPKASPPRADVSREFRVAIVEMDRRIRENPRALEPRMERGRILQAWAEKQPALFPAAVAQWTELMRLLIQMGGKKPRDYYEVIYHAAYCLVRQSATTGDTNYARDAEKLLKSAINVDPKLADDVELRMRYDTLLHAVVSQQVEAIQPPDRRSLLPWTERLKDRDAPTREKAIASLVKLVHDEPTLLPMLLDEVPVEMAEDGADAWRDLLSRLDAQAIPELLARARSDDSNFAAQGREMRFARTCKALEYLGSEVKAAAPLLAKRLDDPSEGARVAAGRALYQINRSTAAISAVVGVLESRFAPTQRSASDALDEIGPEAIPPLLDLAHTGSYGARQRSSRLLDRMEHEQKFTVAAMIECLRSSNAKVREEAASRLMRLGPKAEPAVPALIKATGDQNEFVRFFAIEAIGPQAKAAVPTLAPLLTDKNLGLRASAKNALAHIEGATTK
jgi:HEAT repeat protein